MITVLVADDHAVVRSGLDQLLATADDIELVGSAADGREAVDLAARLEPDVILMDLSMPDVNGIDATRQITDTGSLARIVVLTSLADDRHIADAIDAGAIGYVLKHAEPDDLLDAIRAAAAGDSPLDPKAARVLVQGRARHTGPNLTPREEEVLRLVAEGLANKLIARRLGITDRTVKAHLTRIFTALDVTDRTQAALWAQAHLPPVE
jgi:DNA-binding NarL/FixJ family response regulator